MKKLILTSFILGFSIFSITSSASALTLLKNSNPYQGAVKFEFGSFDAGTTGYPATPIPGTVQANWPGVGADGVLPDGSGSVGADGVAGSSAPNSAPAAPYVAGTAPDGNFFPAGSAREDSWAIFDMTVIRDPSDNVVVWRAGDAAYDGTYMTGYFHHEVDYYIEDAGVDPISGNPLTKIRGVSGMVELWEDPNNDYNGGGGPAARTGFDFYGGANYGYPGATEGTMILQLMLVDGVLLGDTTTTFSSIFDQSQLQGAGTFFADVVDGTLKGLFDTNALLDLNGNLRDTLWDFTATPGLSGWTVNNAGQAQANVVPEPSTFLLLGLGLIGAIFGVRRSAKA